MWLTQRLFEKSISVVSPLWACTNAVARKLSTNSAIRLPKPVISIGNIVAGGVGKTEVTAYIANRLCAQGKSVVIASRGYGSSLWETQGGISQNFQKAQSLQFPDEAMVLLKKTKDKATVTVGKNRAYILSRHWEEINPDVILLDDGFQHFKLARDLDILVHDFNQKWPILRDFKSILNQNTALKISLSSIPHSYSKQNWMKACYHLTYAVNAQDQLQSLPKEALVFCGIGNPKRFLRNLGDTKVIIKGYQIFPDHTKYDEKKVKALVRWQDQKGRVPLLTTLKDYVKLFPYIESQGGIQGFEPLWVHVELKFLEGEDFLWHKIMEVVQK